MKKPNVIASIAFGLGSVSQLVVGNYFAALAAGLFAGALLLSDVSDGSPAAQVAVAPFLTWCRLTSLLLLSASIGLFGYDIGHALHQATHKPTAETQAR